MMDFLRKHMRIIFIVTITGFLGGAFIGFGGYFFGDNSMGDAVIVVNGKKIPYQRYASLLNRTLDLMRERKEEVTQETTDQKKQEVLQDLIQEEVLSVQAKKYGITVSDAELAADIQHYPAFQRDGRFDQRMYFQVLYQALRTTPKEFEESRRKQISIFKLRQLIVSSVRISEPELRLEFARRNRGSTANFEKTRDAFLESLRQEKAMQVFGEWFKTLNQTVKIKVNLQQFEQQGA
ncbi:MAG: SurA N-terminal domain-containing protein [Endomicrobiales bacterium]